MLLELDKIKIEGNSIFIRTIPQTGIIALTSFVDNTTGIVTSKSFRYSLNGIQFTDWQPLTINNITSIVTTEADIVVFELKYDKSASSNVSVDVAIDSDVNPVLEGYYFKNSIFSTFFGTDDINVLNWLINVLEKLFQKGLLPNYLDRYDDNNDATDFLNFWKAICKFFSYYVIYARQYQTFYTNIHLLREFLAERGIVYSLDNTLSQLNILMKQYYYQIAKRGTIKVIETGGTVKGELLRLIQHQDNDEFIFNQTLEEQATWNLDNYSPLYRGITSNTNANKWFEKDIISDISKYNVTGNVTIVNNTLKITGIGGVQGKKINIDPSLDYEFFFLIKKTAGADLTIGFDAYDADGNIINLKAVNTGFDKNNFFANGTLQRSDKYMVVSGILYRSSQKLIITDNFNLKMSSDVVSVAPKITLSNTNAVATIQDIRFLPASTLYNRCFLQVRNWIDIFLVNNTNTELAEMYRVIKKYLLPYNSEFELIELVRKGNGGGFSWMWLETEDGVPLMEETSNILAP
jgi:hypothetical protein